MFGFKYFFVAASIVYLVHSLAFGQADEKEKVPTVSSSVLQVVQNYESESLKGAVGMAISADGRFLYASGYQTATIHVFSIEAKSGRLDLVEKELLPKDLAGATGFCLSPDGKLGLSNAFRSKAITLFKRDTDTGSLSKLQTIASPMEDGKEFQWPIRGEFSTDGKFAYIVDSGMTESIFIRKVPAILVFKVANEKLELVESFEAAGPAMANGRGIAMHPNAQHVFVTSSDGQALLLLSRNESNGKLELVQKVSEPNDVLEGAMSVVVDPSGKFVYTLSGRFRGKGGVAVFAFDESKKSLSFVESYLSGSKNFEQFKGGNQLALSPDGKRVYVIGSTSGTVSIFDRDPMNGKLVAIETSVLRSQWKNSVAGVAVSADSRFVYVSGGERDPSITVLSTQPASSQ